MAAPRDAGWRQITSDRAAPMRNAFTNVWLDPQPRRLQARPVSELYDCAIVGGGPAGLKAGDLSRAIRRKVIVIDRGGSRAALIPKSTITPASRRRRGPRMLASIGAGREITGGADCRRYRGGHCRSDDWRLAGDGIGVTRRARWCSPRESTTNDRDGRDDAPRRAGRGQIALLPDLHVGGRRGGKHSRTASGGRRAKPRRRRSVFLRNFSPMSRCSRSRKCELHEKDRKDLADHGVRWVRAPCCHTTSLAKRRTVLCGGRPLPGRYALSRARLRTQRRADRGAGLEDRRRGWHRRTSIEPRTSRGLTRRATSSRARPSASRWATPRSPRPRFTTTCARGIGKTPAA